MKMREIHLINGPGIVEKFLMLLKPFLKKEIIDAVRSKNENIVKSCLFELEGTSSKIQISEVFELARC